jgi:undecaprenyl-diphosphatase
VFLVGLHVGTAIGLIVFYRATWRRLLKGLQRQLGVSRREGASSLWRLSDASMDRDYRLLFLLVVGCIPVGLVGLVLDKPLRELFAKPLAAAVFLTINGVILIVGERLRRHRGRHARYEKLDTLSARNAITIGSAQIFALLAGISRSGVTMVAALTRGLDHEDAANFSFLLATPVILLAGLYKLPSLLGPLGHGVRTQTFVGALCAGVAASVAVRFLTRWFVSKTLTPFGVYCIVAGVACVARFA